MEIFLSRIRNSLLFLIISLYLCNLPLEARTKVLRIGAIPDQNQEILDRRFKLLSKELSEKLKVKVKYKPMVNYIAAVSGFRTKSLDLVWFGGLTGVQARLQTPNSIIIAQRNVDKEFRSIFITNKKINLKQTTNINDLKLLKNLRFTFGSENSTSGRLMPEYFLNEAGMEIKDFQGERAGFSGSHDSTIALVNSGSYEAGVLNKQIFDKYLVSNSKRINNINIFFITPEYPDYHWLAQGDLDKIFKKGFTSELKNLILSFNKDNTNQKIILDMFNADKFIESDKNQYKKIESIARQLNKIR